MKFAMLARIALLIAIVAITSAKDPGCGGLLEGENGKFDYAPRAVTDGQGPKNCVWVVQAYGATEVQFTLNELLPAGEENALILYPDRTPEQTNLNPVTLNTQGIGTTLSFPSSTAIIILPQPNSSLCFSWDSTPAENLGRNDSVTIADYIDTQESRVTWTPGRKQEKSWWIIDASAEDVVEWKIQVDESGCDSCHPCTCLSLEAFELGCDGYLQEVLRTCGRSSSGVFQMRSSGPLVVAVSSNATQRGMSVMELGWGQDQGSSSTASTTSTATMSTPTTTTTTMSTTTALTTTVSTVATTSTTPPEPGPRIFYTTNLVGLSAFSLESSQVEKIVDTSEVLFGITYDGINDKLYWSTYDKIYRSNKDGSEMVTVLNTTEYGLIYDLAFDWIAMNVYASTGGGFILACSVGSTRAFNCYSVLEGQRTARGICLDPAEGFMYWTSYSSGWIHGAGMDGSNPVTLVTGLSGPEGITIDLDYRKIYWTEYYDNKIRSSNLDGTEVGLVVQLPSGLGLNPYGIAVLNDRIYWGKRGEQILQSATKDGQDIQTLYRERNSIHCMTIVPPMDQQTNRTNDCEGRNCSTVCVLSPTSYRCL